MNLAIKCVVPVAINIKPGSLANPISLRNEVPLAVLITSAGEYGLPLAFNAVAIDPLSVRFGPRNLIWSGSGGASEIHKAGHVEDAYERDERTKDGDSDMVLHFSAAQSGLRVGDTEACVKGEGVGAAGARFIFFGCDTVVVSK